MSIGVFISALLAARMLNILDYPLNYGVLFLTAGTSLSIAAIGFGMVKEVRSDIVQVNSLRDYYVKLKNEITSSPRLRSYLLLVNTLGISLTLLPFLMLYSKENYNIGNTQVGQYLIYKVSAGVLAGLVVYYFSKRFKYKTLLYSIALMAILVPVHLMFMGNESIFPLYFFIGGLIFTFYKVAMEGILLEVSTNENRAIYAGLSGAGYIVPVVFPIAGGWLISSFGFTAFFFVFILIVLLSIIFTWRIDCRK
jgi:MFS-type transporter involved in bile tolerance (Atg22 family)